MKKIIFFLFTLILISSCTQYDYSQIKIIEVIDGDTVRLSSGQLLRYIGLDTPEIRIKENGKFLYMPQPFSIEAKSYNEKLVEGKLARIEFDVEKKDHYGRLLGYCFIDDIFINAKLIEEGYAVLYSRPPNVKYTDLFVNLQKQARRNNKRLWANYAIIDHSQARSYINQIRTVRGKVVDTYQSSKVVFLNFGQDYKTDFTIVIFNDSLDSFLKNNINPATFYRGKTVEVTGKVREYNGPEIIAHSPWEIEVIHEN